jgi:SAM-dependent methyltransferase
VADRHDESGDYYERTAASYDQTHVRSGDEHYVALEYVSGLIHTVRATSVLDVGAGTGRALRFLGARHDGLALCGVEPVEALRAQARDLDLRPGAGESLDFPDGAFDIVMATAVLHHVRHPERVVAEMCRVASRAVVISDINRYGFGASPRRRLKRLLRRLRLLDPIIALRSGGSRRQYSEGDGFHYSFSALDQVDQLSAWGDRVFVVPTRGEQTSGLLVESATHVLVVATREHGIADWAQQP